MAEVEYDKEQLRIMRNAFKAFDHDEKGFIEHSDVQSILEILGQKLDDKAIKALLKEVDKGNTGKLNFSQFCVLASRFVEVEEDANALASELREAFRVYDKEGKGYLSVQVLRDILHELDDKLTKNELDMIIEEIDADGSGTVDFDEFMQVMTGKNYYDFTLHRRFTFDPVYRTCACPTPRMRLHRRIEWHFERFFQHMFQPNQCIVRSHTTTVSSNTNKNPIHNQGSLYVSYKEHKKPQSCCYRPVYRPRFPKWIPILTLYREILQHPFRRRTHYMLTQH